MVVLLQLFYPKQSRPLANDDAVANAADNTVDWLIDRGFRNVAFDVCNECFFKSGSDPREASLRRQQTAAAAPKRALRRATTALERRDTGVESRRRPKPEGSAKGGKA